MEKSIEVELKFEITSLPTLETFLASLKKTDETIETDIYYDNRNGDNFQRGIFIRARNEKRLDFKFNEELIRSEYINTDHTSCNEHSFSLPLQETLLNDLNETLQFLSLEPIDEPSFALFLACNGLRQLVPLTKKRITYTDGTFLYMYDEIEKLGSFLEIEAHTTDKNKVSLLKQEIQNAFTFLPLVPITVGYCELYLRLNRPELYKKGIYLLDQDRNDRYE